MAATRRRSSTEFAPLQPSPLSPASSRPPSFVAAAADSSENLQAYKSRRRSLQPSTYAPVAMSPTSPTSPSRRANPFDVSDNGHSVDIGEDHEMWSAASLYGGEPDDQPIYHSPRRATLSSGGYRPPPSAFNQFPFQSHPGNPDPLPTRRRSSSFESLPSPPTRQMSDDDHLVRDDMVLQPPQPRFMSRSASNLSLDQSGRTSSGSSIFRGSAAAGMMSPTGTGSAPGTPPPTFRAPFLAPSSRPSSSLWTPPVYPYASDSASLSAIGLSTPPVPAPSTRLEAKLSKNEKPWLQRAAPRERASWWLTFFSMFLGLAGAAALCYFGYTGVDKFNDSELCLVMQDDFATLDLQNKWTRQVDLGGGGNGEFQINSNDDKNSYVQNGNLYIRPTLTADTYGADTVNSGTITLDPCSESETNKSACTATGNGFDAVVNPVMSARLSTKDHFSIQYGRVEVKAKLPRGDWLWPSIKMLPVEGSWPVAGELDLMEARGNAPSYPEQGNNFVQATVQYGPFAELVTRAYGWYGMKRSSFADSFHTFGFEWDQTWMRFYVDSQVRQMLYIKTRSKKESFWNRAGFPDVARNGSEEVVVQNPYKNINSPFDKPFYLMINLAVGGTSGWFYDKVGGKPWLDDSSTAMFEFWQAKNKWYSTWPQDAADAAFRIDSVKMWKKC
ncbi:Glycoside hydrolase family 16 protein [Mycena kentingensis (nom. inval.)]|nr:Glycoside hydrolase family 16 protein [Mycena kentingensis (nom. inval.)]